ncbi:MAG: RNA polymerase factor sigma-54 [Lentisphaeria bacterium]|nr:RNA polymerase factor sigma-54 [Lentisphaeria bacterium]
MVQQGFYHSQNLQLRQEQQLAPHQIQSLEILTIPLLDLQSKLNAEMEVNPTLERIDSRTESLAGDPMEEMTALQDRNSDSAGAAVEKDEALAELVNSGDSWQDYMPSSGVQYTSDDAEKRAHFFDSLVTEPTMQEDLLEQIRMSSANPDLYSLHELLIGSLDERGYLTVSVEDVYTPDIANQFSINNIEEAIADIQSLDPAGVGAFDLKDCLLIQLERKEMRKSLAYRIVKSYLDEVARNKIPFIASKLKKTTEEVYEALKFIRELNPRPGRMLDRSMPAFVAPEATIKIDENQNFVVEGNPDVLPKLQISDKYLRLLEDKTVSAEIKAYIREKINTGKLFSKSIRQRGETIRKITEIVLDKQKQYFIEGEEALKPMTMSEVADELGVHETTVSRAIANKFIETPQGLVSLKTFFTGGYQSEDGDMLSAKSIKHKISSFVADEAPQKPLSDQKIVELLNEAGLDVARRTVAKYREELGIPSSRLRKSHGK